ncbi:DUF3667 domain-containing protein [Flavobacterium difficile]|uniref:DUF3667 domain-containing protein n=1 Tax=Flavobacterium difficile TaxID=2709659 RepID=A0ABX0I886_9FLAO|nr:DUF3667 domain-containing protein [Flavobacterium difficile]NHM02861.1 DUF3667 domain-containing protein [Flavobacterium difficile]
MSHPTTCLNCNEKLIGKFCFNCGQKSDTHRITLKHFLFHDILHGVWHIDKGILFTIKEALTRPGQAALDYIAGKRIRYYNVFYLILILIGLNIFLSNQYDKMASEYLGTVVDSANAKGKAINDFLTTNSKLIIFLIVPLFALNSFILFRRKKLNISEHFILAGMIYLGILILTFIVEILSFLEFIKYGNYITDYLLLVYLILIFTYAVRGYYKTFESNYTKINFTIRILFFLVLLFLEISFLIILLLGFISKWKFGSFQF